MSPWYCVVSGFWSRPHSLRSCVLPLLFTPSQISFFFQHIGIVIISSINGTNALTTYAIFTVVGAVVVVVVVVVGTATYTAVFVTIIASTDVVVAAAVCLGSLLLVCVAVSVPAMDAACAQHCTVWRRHFWRQQR